MEQVLGGHEMKHPCAGCVYWRAMGSNESLKACHYLLDEGSSRPCAVGEGSSRPCAVGEGCIVRRERSRKEQGEEGRRDGAEHNAL